MLSLKWLISTLSLSKICCNNLNTHTPKIVKGRHRGRGKWRSPCPMKPMTMNTWQVWCHNSACCIFQWPKSKGNTSSLILSSGFLNYIIPVTGEKSLPCGVWGDGWWGRCSELVALLFPLVLGVDKCNKAGAVIYWIPIILSVIVPGDFISFHL